MAIQNKTQYAILGILSISPGSGYDIKKYCDTVISNVWNENFGHIYPVLKSMSEKGLIEQQDPNESVRRKEYKITKMGLEEFYSWLSEPTNVTPVRSEFMLKFLFSSNLPTDNIVKMLEDYKKYHIQKHNELSETEKELKQGNENIRKDREVFLRASLRYGILSAESGIKWCDEVIEMLQKG